MNAHWRATAGMDSTKVVSNGGQNDDDWETDADFVVNIFFSKIFKTCFL